MEAEFAVLSVRAGRKDLARRTAAGEQVPVTIHGHVSYACGRDDGADQEFQVNVHSVTEGEVGGPSWEAVDSGPGRTTERIRVPGGCSCTE